jgi:regulator of replication initiation timing
VSDVHAVQQENENLKSNNEALQLELQSLKAVLEGTQSSIEMNKREQSFMYKQTTRSAGSGD